MNNTTVNSSPILSITGERIALGPQRRDLVPLSHRWLNDFAVMSPLGAPLRLLANEGAVQVYEDSERATDQVWFTLYERAALRPIGITGLHDIDRLHRTAEFVIFIGEKDCWGKGYGTEAARLILDYGFNALGLHNIMLKVFGFNERGIRAYRRAGFREIGRRRRAFRLASETYDVISMDCLAAEFTGSDLGRVAASADPSPDPSPTRGGEPTSAEAAEDSGLI